LVVVAITAIAGAGAFASPEGGATALSAASPFQGTRLYVDPHSRAMQALTQYPLTAEYVRVIADTPQARWYGSETPTTELSESVDSYVSKASLAGDLAVLVAYAIPFRDCEGYSRGGLKDAAEYTAWIRAFRAGIAGRRVAVVLEPDALSAADCLSSADRQRRLEMLRDAVTELTADASTALYIDGGNSRWLSASDLADRLRQVGVGKARGFSLNVSNFYSTSEEVTYGESVSQLLGGAHYVIDTSRNGRGPSQDEATNWCNPSGRSLGAVPTAVTGAEHADALLWIKRPGESDGECDRGDPNAGSWFNNYAVDIVKQSER
jgi:endoglucanase